MSFILDALRKSDTERQRAATPGLTDVRYVTRRARRNIWLPILVVVLAANVVFMGVWWFGRGGGRPAAAPEIAAPEIAAPAPPATGEPTAVPATTAQAPEVAPGIRPLARETEYGEPVVEPEMDGEFAPPPEPASTASTPSTPEPELAPAPAPAPTAPAKPSRILANSELPTAEQLIGSGELGIPMLNLDLHVYSEKPAGRFVVINSRKYKEGGQLTEGPTVDVINKDGVILAYQGRRFTLASR